MRANEFIIETQELDEIKRLAPDGFSGGKEYLDSYGREKSVQELPEFQFPKIPHTIQLCHCQNHFFYQAV